MDGLVLGAGVGVVAVLGMLLWWCPHDGFCIVVIVIVGVGVRAGVVIVVDGVSAAGVEEEEGRCFYADFGVSIAFFETGIGSWKSSSEDQVLLAPGTCLVTQLRYQTGQIILGLYVRKTASPSGPFDMRRVSAWWNVTSARHVCGSRRR